MAFKIMYMFLSKPIFVFRIEKSILNLDFHSTGVACRIPDALQELISTVMLLCEEVDKTQFFVVECDYQAVQNGFQCSERIYNKAFSLDLFKARVCSFSARVMKPK